MARADKVGFWYRLGWSINYGLLSIIGPAHLDARHDPRVRMRAERDARERRAAKAEQARRE